MASTDAPQLRQSQQDSANSSPAALAAAMPGVVQKLTALDKWLNGRIEEVQAAEGRVEARVQHLCRLETSLKSLCDSLRSGVADATATIQRLGDERETHRMALADALRTSKQELEQAGRAVRDELKDIGAAAIRKDLWATAEAVRSELTTSMDNLRRDADATLALTRTRVREAIDEGAAKLDHFKQQVARATESAVAEGERRLSGALVASSGALQQRIESLEQESVESADLLSARLAHLTDDFAAHAAAQVAAAKESVWAHVRTLEEEASIAIRPILSRIEDEKHAAECQVRALMESAERTLRHRTDELRRAADDMIGLTEQNFSARLAGLRPRAESAIELGEKGVAERLAQTLSHAEEVASLGQEQLLRRIDALRAQAIAAAREAERRIATQSAMLSEQAMEHVEGVERRLNERVDDLVRQSTQLLAQEVGRTDRALATLTKLDRRRTALGEELLDQAGELSPEPSRNDPMNDSDARGSADAPSADAPSAPTTPARPDLELHIFPAAMRRQPLAPTVPPTLTCPTR